MLIKDLRRANLTNLIEAGGGNNAFAKRIRMSYPSMTANYLSQLKNGTKGISNKTAAKIEAAASIGEGYLSIDHSNNKDFFSPEFIENYIMSLSKADRARIAINLVRSLSV